MEKYYGKLILKSNEENKLDKVNKIKQNSYCWDFPKNITLSFTDEILALLLINSYLRDCSDDEHKLLTKKTTYLRFMIFQDETNELPNSYPYIYGYLREINNCSFESHKNFLNSIDSDYLPCEINYSTYAIFVLILIKEWISKNINPLNLEIID